MIRRLSGAPFHILVQHLISIVVIDLLHYLRQAQIEMQRTNQLGPKKLRCDFSDVGNGKLMMITLEQSGLTGLPRGIVNILVQLDRGTWLERRLPSADLQNSVHF